MPDISKIILIDGSECNIKDATARAGLETKAPLVSPALTGTPTAPTASAGTNTTQIATTAFVTTATNGVYKRPYYQQGTTDIAMRPLVDYARANRLAFLPADQIIIEKTTDGGTTWVDAGISDAYKRNLFSTRSGNIQIPLLNGAKSTQCGVRVTISGMKYNVPDGTIETGKYAYWNSTYVKSNERYCNLREMWFWISANNDTIRVQVQRATGANPDTWKDTFTTDFGMTGWSGSDWIRWDAGWTFGGGTNQTGNDWNWRIYFWSRIPDGKTEFQSATAQQIQGINGYGDSVWGAPNGLMEKDHLYRWDANMNATFPAGVTATSFTGNASTATKLAASKTIQTNLASTSSASFDGSANITPGVTGTLGTGNGGTGVSTLGTSGQVLRVNSAGTALEWGTITSSVTATKQKLVKTTVPNVTNVGSAPTLGTAFSVPNVTGNTSVSASKVTKTDDTFVKTISQATSTSSVIGTVSGGVLTLSKAITAVGAVSAGTTGTASAVSISDVTATNTTLGTAFSIPNITSVGSAPTLGTAISVATGATSTSGTGSEVVIDVSSS